MNAPFISPISAAARHHQMALAMDTEGTHYATVDGTEREFTAYFTAERVSGTDGQHRACEVTKCSLIGAISYSLDDGSISFAGNREEVVALIGQREVWAWEDAAGREADE